MKGLILAGGKGSRLYPVTHHIPKPLLPIANRLGLEYAFDCLKDMAVQDICLVVGENESSMKAALGDGRQFGVQLTYVRQPEPKGLAHAVGCAEDAIKGEDFVLYLGDEVYSRGFRAEAELFKASDCANLNIVQAVEDPSRFGVATVVDGRIVKLEEKPKNPTSNLVMAGLYFFGPEIWEVLPTLRPSARGEYEITDAIQELIHRGHLVLASEFDGEWFDTGTLESFLETNRFLIDGEGLFGEGSVLEGQVGENVVIGDGAIVEAEIIEDSVVLPGARVKVAGSIRHCLLGGEIWAENSLEGQILYGGQE